MQRIAITGSSGYLGVRLIERLRERFAGTTILGLDIRPPQGATPDEFASMDVCSSDLGAAIDAFRPDTIIHTAFVFSPIHDEERMRRINVEGTRNVLAAAVQAALPRLMVVSSATAYGAWPDNPVPMDESWPLRARLKFRYAADKTIISEMVQQFAAEQPDMIVSQVRPAIIGGPKMANYLSRFIFGMPFLVLIDGYDTPLQFVHEDDVADAMLRILSRDARGVFNIGPPNWTHLTEIAQATRRRAFRLPFWFVRFLHGLAWAVRFPLHESPASLLDFARYPWVVASTRLERELGFRFQYSSTDVMHDILRHSNSR